MATELARSNGSGGGSGGGGGVDLSSIRNPSLYSFQEKWDLADAIAKSRFIKGVENPQAAMALMLVCEAEGRHIGDAIKRFHVFFNQPSIKARVLLEEFRARDGVAKINPQKYNKDVVEIAWSHPKHQPEPIVIETRMEELIRTGAACEEVWESDPKAPSQKRKVQRIKPMFEKFPRKMLFWANVREGVDLCDSGASNGLEIAEDDPEGYGQTSRVLDVTPSRPELASSPKLPARGDVAVPGQPTAPNGLDERPYVQVVTEATAAVNTLASQDAADKLDGEIPPAIVQGLTTREVHRWLLNAAAQAGHYSEAPPSKLQHAVAILGRLYGEHRDWMREQLNMCLESHIHNCGVAVQLAQERRAAESAQDAAEAGDEPLEPLPAGAREPGSEG
jgi:hypothetical protein